MKRAGLWVLCALVLAGQAPGQKSRAQSRKWRTDPYTRNDPKAMQKAGYISFGSFEFGQRGRKVATTEQIDEALPKARILWVETRHFRIGISLAAWAVPNDLQTRRKLRGELERLAVVLPRVKPRTRVLDPWLRIHLIAMRAEEQYREFLDWVGVDDSEFPESADKVVIGRGRYLGYGPYLGMQQKYLLFITEEVDTYVTYMQTFTGKRGDYGQRLHFLDIGALFYGVAAKMEGSAFRHDTALHANLTFNIAHGFVDGFRHYSYDVPVWISEGLAHYFERRVSPLYNSFSQSESVLADTKPGTRWRLLTRKLITAHKGTPFARIMTWRDFGQIGYDDHVLIWSRWDYLMSMGKEKFAEFMFQVKGRIDPKTWIVDQSDLVGATRDGLRKAYGLTPLSLDEEWQAWVRKTYPTR